MHRVELIAGDGEEYPFAMTMEASTVRLYVGEGLKLAPDGAMRGKVTKGHTTFIVEEDLDETQKQVMAALQSYLYLRPEVRRFAAAMEQKLRANDAKGGWKDCTPFEMIQRAQEELRELECEVRRIPPGVTTTEECRKEAADVANFLMMVVER